MDELGDRRTVNLVHWPMRFILLLWVAACTKDPGPAGRIDPGPDPTSSEDTGATSTDSTHETDWSVCQIDIDCTYGQIWDEPKQSCEFRVTEGNGYVLYEGWGGMERRGRSSINWEKANFSVEFWKNANTVLLRPDSVWQYFDGPDVGDPSWNQPGFDDTLWSQGMAALGWGPLGQEDRDPDTTINSGNVTSWYRQTFEVEDPSALDPIYLYTRFDDALIAYINGVEVVRSNLGPGPVDRFTETTFVHTDEDEIVWDKHLLDPAVLVAGENLVAIEIHQSGPDSSDSVMQAAIATKPEGESPSFFEMGGDEDWILGGAYVDLTLWRNVFVYDLFNEMRPGENFAPETHYCHVDLNGAYHGLYQLTEKIKRDDDRLDLAEEDGDGQSFILKTDDTRHFYDATVVRKGWQLIYPNDELISDASSIALQAYLFEWEAAAYGGNVWDYVDMESMVDWMIIQEFTKNGDAYVLSLHVYKDEGEKIKFIPWDMDITFGLSCNSGSGWLGDSDSDLVSIAKEDPVFQQAFRDRWRELRQGVMSDGAILDRVDAIKLQIFEDVERNFERWPQDEMIGADDWVLDFSEDCPTFSWVDSDAASRQWINERLLWMDANIDSFP